MYQKGSSRIADIIREFREGKAAIPRFQRDPFWKKEEILQLAGHAEWALATRNLAFSTSLGQIFHRESRLSLSSLQGLLSGMLPPSSSSSKPRESW